MTGRDHNRLLSIFFMIIGGLSLFGGLVFALIYGGLGVFILTSAPKPDARTAGAVFTVIGLVFGLIMTALSILFFLAGWRMYKENPAGRTLGMVASILCLMNFPLGTALGIYGIWFLFTDQGKAFYDSLRGITSHAPPPPNSWQ